MIKLIYVLLVATVANANYQDVVMDCGAIPKWSLDVSVEDTNYNTMAIEECFKKANETDDKTVVIPEGYVISANAMHFQNLYNVTFQIDGILETSPHWKNWTLDASNKSYANFMTFDDCEMINIKGKGTVDGLGYDWWVRDWAHENPFKRPILLQYNRVQTSEITGVKWVNSPRFYLKLADIDSVYIHDMEIITSVFKHKGSVSKQKQNSIDERIQNLAIGLLRHFLKDYSMIVEGIIPFLEGRVELAWPTMPLNTDGIDPSGSRITIENVNITNWDDSVVIKPADSRHVVTRDGCSQDISVHNVNVMFGVGMSIGSINPSPYHHCIRRVRFNKVNFEYPMKAIYIKTNPGTSGTGEVRDVIFENIKIHNSIWYAIYIGPQQQKQPDGRGPGCMTYPFDKCDTQALIDIRNITLKNVESTGGLLPPGVIRCNATNPCKDINLIDVKMNGWWKDMNWTFISEYADGKVENVYPDPGFGKQDERVFQLITVDHAYELLNEMLQFYNFNETDILAWTTLSGIVLWALSMAVKSIIPSKDLSLRSHESEEYFQKMMERKRAKKLAKQHLRAERRKMYWNMFMHVISNPLMLFIEVPEFTVLHSIDIFADILLLAIYGFGDVILFFLQNSGNYIIYGLEEPLYMLGLMNNPIDDFIDVDYFTFQNIKGELMWTDNKEIFK